MTNILEITIFVSRLIIAAMLLQFVFLQWHLRFENGIVGRLRRHTIWETIALVVMFLQIAFFRFFLVDPKVEIPLLIQLSSFAVNIFVFLTFASGIHLFLDIKNGKTKEH